MDRARGSAVARADARHRPRRPREPLVVPERAQRSPCERSPSQPVARRRLVAGCRMDGLVHRRPVRRCRRRDRHGRHRLRPSGGRALRPVLPARAVGGCCRSSSQPITPRLRPRRRPARAHPGARWVADARGDHRHRTLRPHRGVSRPRRHPRTHPHDRDHRRQHAHRRRIGSTGRQARLPRRSTDAHRRLDAPAVSTVPGAGRRLSAPVGSTGRSRRHGGATATAGRCARSGASDTDTVTDTASPPPPPPPPPPPTVV